MSPTLIVSLAAVIIAGLGTVTAAIITRGKKDNPGGNPGSNPGNSYVRESTCAAMHEGISRALDALGSETRNLGSKVDKMMMHFKISSE